MSVALLTNKFQAGSNFVGVTKTMKEIIVESTNMYHADGLDFLPELAVLHIQNNELKTMPDLLGLPNIRKLYIKGNSRMNCDQRMCWRRLRERMREPISYPDDVTCVEPPLSAGDAISTINPKFMHYWNGKFWLAPSAILRLNAINISMRTCPQQAVSSSTDHLMVVLIR